ncbi:MAG: hypothetical protein GOU97_04160 [Nanoarchaeota archaeon]|nr:hypothetical protein [Nanoarchaeota archaeon]
MDCKNCGKKASAVLDYEKKWYCKDCFIKIIEKRFKAYISQHGGFEPKDSVLVSLSPHASGVACAHLIGKLKAQMPKLKVKGVYINLHYRPYSDKAEKMFRKNDYGIQVIFRNLNPKTCESCRDRRAKAINQIMKKDKYKKLVTGRDADSKTIQYLSNFFQKKVPENTGSLEPMSRISRKEARIYCQLNRLKFVGDCPHREKYEKMIKKMIDRVEKRIPGAMLAFAKAIGEL